LVDRTLRGGPYLYLLMTPEGETITGNIETSPITPGADDPDDRWEAFRLTVADEAGRIERRQALGAQFRLSGGELLFVGEDIGDTEAYLDRLTQALWGAMLLVLILGLGG